ncbi:Signal recognition particle GTPase [Levilactobacillus senmaizukei DSM 21775 = NBRC 103853]|uniref:Signal recognition particle receptor FtsY n=1 Tax=Levilactobacillus senmaizukei DSM 21775 = NBRC 103853 TaxID=1423803 RepID=A0A0R2DPU7_9LACO|nr:signal recognition particle-docking protein FtsY [Levilactobacillus senmaizukei]KRN02266.1 Signal recognition particle GTPase [Levilactobacillus senmaizukei DSM 21775 = NBRC 103853]
MGLFDIFRRRAKEEPNSQAENETPVSENDAATEAPVASEATETSETTSEATPAVSESEATEPVSKSETDAISESTSDESEPSETATNETVTTSAAEDSTSDTSESEAPLEESEAEPTPVDETETPVEKTDEQLYDQGLEKTRTTFGERLNALLANFRHVDESFFDDLEETLIGADVGFDMAVKLSDELRDEVKLQNAKKPQDVQNVVVEKLVEIYDAAGNDERTTLNMAESGPTVILFVGVNGVGKTTTIGKMANRYHEAGKKVLLAAADTFRAGATEQLDVWAKRADVDIVTGKPQSDPAAVVFDAVQKAKKEDYDILFVDTAGRLQNKVNLMNELSKMKRIITREIPAAPHEVLLVLDATTGQNALTQAKLFKESTDVTGIVLTKLDGTARGGIVLAIRNELHVPVKFIGLGEQISDLRPFDPNEFVYGLFKGLIDVNALKK